MKKILVTGAAGFIGSHLVEKLIAEGHTVVGIDNFDSYYSPQEKELNLRSVRKNKKFTLIKGDIQKKLLIAKTLNSLKPGVVVHLAAKVGARNSLIYPKKYFEVNTLGTLTLLEELKKHTKTQLVLASSSSVYGNNSKLPFSETDRVNNQISPYAVSKRASELLCKQYAALYHIPTVCLRFFSVYGPRQRPDLVIRKYMKNIHDSLPIDMYGEGNSSRDYTYIDDIVGGIIKCLIPVSAFEIINLGNSKPIKLMILLRLIEKVMHKKAVIKFHPPQDGDAQITCANIEKARKLLRWVPTTDITMGLRKTNQWYFDK